jgi:hypothetical protein
MAYREDKGTNSPSYPLLCNASVTALNASTSPFPLARSIPGPAVGLSAPARPSNTSTAEFFSISFACAGIMFGLACFNKAQIPAT